MTTTQKETENNRCNNSPSSPFIEPSSGTVSTIGRVDQVWGRTQSNGDDAPQAVSKVNGNGIDNIVNFELHEELTRAKVDSTSNATNKDGNGRVDHRAPSRDGNEAGETTVHGACQIEHCVESV